MTKEKKKRITPTSMWESFLAYKEECNRKTVFRTEFSQRESRFVTAEIPAPVTATEKGFAAYLGMTETNFHVTYGRKEAFKPVFARIKEECELDARTKFENGTINSRLAGLWMSNYGYTTNTNAEVKADVDTELHITVDYGENEK